MTSRRNFLKLGAIAATATATFVGTGALTNAEEPRIKGGRDYSPDTGKARQAIPSACWQCVSRCPMIGYTEGGRLVKVEGQPNSIRTDGKVCAKAQAGPNQVYDPDRILFPMRRVGNRGEGKWKRVSWDDALTKIAGRLKTSRRRPSGKIHVPLRAHEGKLIEIDQEPVPGQLQHRHYR